MTDTDRAPEEMRVLILTPTGKDGALTQALLERAGVPCLVCADTESLCAELASGAAVVLVAEEALTGPTLQQMADLLAGQLPWSDLPVLVLTSEGADSPTVAEALSRLGNVTLLERPTRLAALVSAVQAARKARQRQYQIRTHLVEQQRAEETKALLAAIVESCDDAIISKTLDGIITSWNTGAERLFGYSAAEVIGRSILLLLPPDRHDEEAGILAQLRRGQRIDHYETRRVSRSGQFIDVSLTVSPIRDGSGRISGASKVARDITARKRTEAALKEVDRRKDEFLATLAHELRNPLAPLRNSLHILRLAANPDPTVERIHQMMERQVNHLVRLVDDLLEVSRITRGKIELRKERVELAGVIRSAVETSGPLIESAGHQLAIALPPDPLILEADPVRLTQVFANLLNNAAKYADEPGQIWLTVRREGRGVAVSVRDTGIGIAADMLPHVFEMFTQGEGARRRAQGGLGIGLTLVRSLVQMHGGSVTAFSEGPGKGSEFVVHLPLAGDDGPADTTAPAVRPAGALDPLRVLVVDDNRDAAESLGILLEHLGAEVQVVHDGLAALAALETYRPAVVLLDLGMPGMDGYEVAHRIRQQPRFRDVVLIALTGWGQEQDRRRSQSAGFDHHLIKPADADTLQGLMRSLAGHEGRRRPNRRS